MAVLSRETALLVIVLLALERPLGWLTDGLREPRMRPARSGPPTTRAGLAAPPLVWAVPVAVFMAWQVTTRLATGTWPLLTSGRRNLDIPFVGLVDGFRHYGGKLPSTSALLWLGELLTLVVVVVAAALALRTTTSRLYERAAWVAYGIVTLTLAPGIWLGDVGFRSFDDLYVFSCIVLLSSRRRLTVPALLVAVGWTIVVVELVTFV